MDQNKSVDLVPSDSEKSVFTIPVLNMEKYETEKRSTTHLHTIENQIDETKSKNQDDDFFTVFMIGTIVFLSVGLRQVCFVASKALFEFHNFNYPLALAVIEYLFVIPITFVWYGSSTKDGFLTQFVFLTPGGNNYHWDFKDLISGVQKFFLVALAGAVVIIFTQFTILLADLTFATVSKSTSPAFTAWFGYLFLHEQRTMQGYLLLFLIVVAAITISVLLFTQIGSHTSWTGAFLCYLYPVIIAGYHLYSQHILKHASMQDFVFFTYPMILVICVSLFLCSNELHPLIKTIQHGLNFELSMWLVVYMFSGAVASISSLVILKNFSAVSLSVYRKFGMPVMFIVGVTFFGDQVINVSILDIFFSIFIVIFENVQPNYLTQ